MKLSNRLTVELDVVGCRCFRVVIGQMEVVRTVDNVQRFLLNL